MNRPIIAPMDRRNQSRLFTRCTAVACGVALLSACNNPVFTQKNYLARPITREQLQVIDSVQLSDESKTPPVSVDQAAQDIIQKVAQKPPPAEKIDLALADVRAAALANNLDLKVDVINPSIAAQDIDIEEARFESTFVASARRSITDSPTTVETEGSRSTVDSYNLGVNVPLRTGGSVNVNFPLSDIETNNPFSALNPAYTSDLRFSISQPLLRNAGVNVNTHSIRVAQYQEKFVSAQTKLEAIRILADADRVYWTLYSARRQLEVRQQQYELNVAQLEQARRRVNAGDAAPIEVTRAESGVASGLQDIIIAQAEIHRRQRDLKRIMNRDDLPMNGPTEVFIATQPQPVGLNLDAEALATRAVENRMEMLELELQLAIDASAIDFRRNQKLPLVTLDYIYSINGLGGSYNRSLNQLTDNRFNDWTVGINAEIPIGNEGAKASYQQAILVRLQRLATKEMRSAAIRQEVYDALEQLEQNWQRILAARLASLLAGRTYEGEQRQFEVGLRTSTDVQNALATLADAQSQEVRALADYQISQVDIAFATGTLLGNDKIRWEPHE
jgi:outer membrane protein